MIGLHRELKPYIARAVYDWCIDNGLRPLLIARFGGRSQLPKQFAADGKMALDLSAAAVRGLEFSGDVISFSTCFGRQVHYLSVHIEDVVWLGSPLRGIGLDFGPESRGPNPKDDKRKKSKGDQLLEQDEVHSPDGDGGGGGHLRLV